ncbi:MAG: diguanylate cyclase [Solirubrobacteraceae bacterium]|nr:diguanylate cyclase [Solirubrobacteraceae bacterium]
MADPGSTRAALRQEALRAARGLSEGDGALVEVLRDLERERGRAAESARAVVRALTLTLQARDGYTQAHADAVEELSLAVGRRLGLDERALAELSAVALLHDVGKIGIPDVILHKPGPLTDAEWEVMRTHPVIGERILAAVPGLESVARAVRHEHERWDGDGYPDGLAGEAIPLPSRIVLACDAWHALVSDRPYRAGLPREAALAELARCAGTQFDPRVAEALAGVLEDPDEARAPHADPADAVADLAGVGTSLERELIALIAVASAVAAAHRIEEVIEIAAEEAREAIGAASLSIERWLEDRSMLRTLINVGDLAPGEDRHPADEIYRLEGDRMLRSVLQEGGTYFCSLDDADLPPIERDLLTGLGKHSSVAVPIMFGGETWGQIWAARREDQPSFDERDARFLHAISGQIGAAIGRAEVFSRVTELAHTDGLTGLANRRAFDEALEVAVLEARRDGQDIALFLCDMDNLKETNDHHGHDAGDVALRAVAGALVKATETCEGALVCRVGGDEFCVLLRGADDRRAREIAETVHRRLSSAHPPVGVSSGVAMLPGGNGRPADLLRAADAAQYAAKRAGRGRVFVAGPSGAVPGAALGDAGVVHQRALRDAHQSLDLGRLLTETLGVLDGPLAGAPPAERLGGVLRRAAELLDAVGWTAGFQAEGDEIQALALANRPGAGAGLVRRSPWLSARDLLAARMAGAPAAQGGGILIERQAAHVPALVRRHLTDLGLDALLLVTCATPTGTWVGELGADARTQALGDVEPVLRVLIPEALRAGVAAAQRSAGAGA